VPSDPEIAVAFVIREKFSYALASLRRLYAFAGAPFRLYVVDSVYPDGVRTRLDQFLRDKADVVRIPAERFLYPTEAVNLVIERAREPYLFILQNDVLIAPGALQFALDTMKRLDCGVVSPVIYDVEAGGPSLHRHTDAPAAILEENGLIHLTRAAVPERREDRERIHHLELHCLLMKTAAARAVAPLPPLNVHEHIDLCIALWRNGQTAYLDKRARVLYAGSPPLPLRDLEHAYYSFRWDVTRARQSHRYVRDRWRTADLFDPLHFVERQHTALQPSSILTHYDSVFDADIWPEGLVGD
jgi:GT2 family glycosyltransferase